MNKEKSERDNTDIEELLATLAYIVNNAKNTYLALANYKNDLKLFLSDDVIPNEFIFKIYKNNILYEIIVYKNKLDYYKIEKGSSLNEVINNFELVLEKAEREYIKESYQKESELKETNIMTYFDFPVIINFRIFPDKEKSNIYSA